MLLNTMHRKPHTYIDVGKYALHLEFHFYEIPPGEGVRNHKIYRIVKGAPHNQRSLWPDITLEEIKFVNKWIASINY